MFKHKQFLTYLTAAISLVILAVSSTAAVSAVSSSSESVVQSYGADIALQQGMIVKLNDKDPNKVEPLSLSTIKKMQGVVVTTNNAALVLSPTSKYSHQVYVATFGRYGVLVSTQNGPIHVGDWITISSLDGVGMKANGNQSLVLGKAAGNFDGVSNVEGTANLADQGGKKTSVSLGHVPVDISISHNPLEQKPVNYVPGILQTISTGVANKPVSAARIYLGLAVLLISAFLTGGILYSSIRNSLIAIGRNPLAKKSVVHGLLQAVLSGLIIFIIGIFAVYLLLKL